MKILILLLLLAIPTVSAQEVETFDVPMDSQGYNLNVSPDGRLAAVYESNILLQDMPDLFTLPIRLFDLETGEEIGFLAGQSDFATDFAFSPDGARAASIHTNGDIHLWDIEAQDQVAKFETLLLGGGGLQFLADGQTLAVLASALKGSIIFIDTATGAITRIIGRHFTQYNDFRENYTTAPGIFDLVFADLAVSPDSSLAAVATANDEVILFNLRTGRSTSIREPNEQYGRLSIRRLEFSDDGSQLIYVMQGNPSTLHIWDIEEREEVMSEEMGSLAWDYRDGLLAWADRTDQALRVVDLNTSNVLLEQTLDGRVTPLSTVAITTDAVIVGGLQSETDQNVLLRFDLEAGD